MPIVATHSIATVATGGAAGGVAGFILAGAFKGAIIGAVSGALISGTIGGIVSVVNGNSFWSGFAEGAANGFMSGAIVGGITGAISSGIQVANAAKAWGTAFDVNGKVLRTPYKNVVFHYKHHVIKENMKGVAKNIVNYTKTGKNLWSQSSNMAKILPSGNLKIAFTKSLGSGGIYTVLGKILSIFLR